MRKQSLPLFHSPVYHLALELARRLKSLPGNQPQPHVLVLEKTNSTVYHLGPAAAKPSLHGVKHLCTEANKPSQEEEMEYNQQWGQSSKELKDPNWCPNNRISKNK